PRLVDQRLHVRRRVLAVEDQHLDLLVRDLAVHGRFVGGGRGGALADRLQETGRADQVEAEVGGQVGEDALGRSDRRAGVFLLDLRAQVVILLQAGRYVCVVLGRE